MVKLYSVDIFDTCLTRLVDDPNDAFLLLRNELEQHIGPLLTGLSCADIYSARIRADAFARSRTSAEEITLEQIWLALAEILSLPAVASQWNVELDIERKLLRAMPETLEYARRVSQSGHRVIYISDTYLPAWFLKERLTSAGFPVAENQIYVSSECGVRKSSGKLFSKVLEKELVSARDMIHLGDHPISDGTVPERMGIKSVVIGGTSSSAGGSFGLKCSGLPRLVSSGITKQQRLLCAAYDREKSGAGILVGQLIGPVLVAFVSWVLLRAKSCGVKRLYFMARDGRLAWVVARVLSKASNELDCRYLPISRQAVFLPSITEVSPKGMPWMRRSFERPVVGTLFGKLEIPWDEVARTPGAFTSPEVELDTEEKWDTFWKLLCREPLRDFLERRIAIRRSAAIAYYQQAGLFDGVPWGVVDIGWHGHCQRAMALILRHEHPQMQSRGFYMGLETERVSLGALGTAEALFDRTRLLEGKAEDEMFFGHSVLWEHTLGIADHPWVCGYKQTAEGSKAEFRDATISPAQAELFSKVEPSLQSYAEAAVAWAAGIKEEQTARSIILQSLQSALENPSPRMVELLCGISVTLDQASSQQMALVEPWTFAESLVLACPGRLRSLLGVQAPHRFWPQASLAVSDTLCRSVIGTGGGINRVLRNALAMIKKQLR